MRARLKHPFFTGDVYYGVGVHDFDAGVTLPGTAETVDPDEVAADVVGEARGDRMPIKGVVGKEPDTLHELGKKK